MTKPVDILLRAYPIPTHGYGRIACALARHLVSVGRKVAIRHLGRAVSLRYIPTDLRRLVIAEDCESPWELIIAPPGESPKPGRPTVYFTMWETTRLVPDHVGALKVCRAVIVPSVWCQQIFDAHEVYAHVVPLGVDHAVFHPWAGGGGANLSCLFGTAGRTDRGGVRKGFEIVLEAFTLAFPGKEEVRLEIKCSEACKMPVVTDERVAFIRESWTDQQMADWYRRLRCFVSGSRSEAFGLHIVEAMACGTPVIATKHAGQGEYVNESTAVVVPYSMVPAMGRYDGLGLWAEPDIWRMSDALRKVYEDQEPARKLAVSGRALVDDFRWEHTCERVTDILRGLGAFDPVVAGVEVGDQVLRAIGPAKERYVPPTPLVMGKIENNDIVVVGPHPEACGVGQYARQVALALGCRFTAYGNSLSERIVFLHHHRHYWERWDILQWVYRLVEAGHEIILDVHDPGGIEQLTGYASKVVYHSEHFREYVGRHYPDRQSEFVPMMCPIMGADGRCAVSRPNTQYIVGWHGLVAPHKGLLTLIGAVKLLRDRSRDVGLLAQGGIHDLGSGSERARSQAAFDACVNAVEHYSMSEHVKLHCAMLSYADIRATLGYCDVFCLPYTTMIPGNTSAALVCLALERPLVVTPVPMFRDIAGAALESRDISAEAVAEALEQVLYDSEYQDWRLNAMAFHAQHTPEVVSQKYRAFALAGSAS